MKIGIATYNGKMISKHFGRSKFFVIFDIEDGKVVNKEIRENTFTAHARGEHGESGHEHRHQHQHRPGMGHHSHTGIVNALKDCDAVLCYGMGWRAAEDLKANGIKACILTDECTMDEAVQAYIEGRITESEEFFCRCQTGTKKVSD